MCIHMNNRNQCSANDIYCHWLWCNLIFSLYYDVFYFIKKKKASCDPTNWFNDLQFDKQWPKGEWMESVRKKNKAYTIFLSWEKGNICWGWLQPAGWEGILKGLRLDAQLCGGASSQAERLLVRHASGEWTVGAPETNLALESEYPEAQRGAELV